MQLDAYVAGPRLPDVATIAQEVEALGFDGLWFTESSRNPYLGCAAAALATRRIAVGTDVAVAFPRSPMVTAQAAWDLADASGGRFILGLGSQVKAHVVRRFSVAFDRPAARLREYVLALRAIFRAFQGTEPLRFEGEFYRFSLLTDFFSAGPIAQPDIPIYVAGVNELTARMAGEVCDGFHVHPVHSRSYLEKCVRPAIADGAGRAGRDPGQIALACPVFIIAADSADEREKRRRVARRQIAFYASTPNYRTVLEHHGWGDAAQQLNRLMAKGDVGGMEALISDAMLEEFALSARWDDLPAALLARYAGLVDRVFPYVTSIDWREPPASRERWSEVARALRAA